jgi:redox-sensitive bicupin YhaK (pirin superfamily)
MRHRDSAGHEGLLVPGQRAVDDRRPRRHPQRDARAGGRPMEGFQLWLNLPARDKMCEPWYRDIAARREPEWQGGASPCG